MEQGARLWDTLAEAGAPHGIVPFGIGVYGTTGRLEKGYPYTPLAAAPASYGRRAMTTRVGALFVFAQSMPQLIPSIQIRQL
jgi:hypothetical protein